jgi:cobalt-zinc-cadmium efflux system outer membrane protein
MGHVGLGIRRHVCAQVFLAVCLTIPGRAQAPPPARITVEEAVAEAIQNNLSLLAERANIGIAEAHILTARLRPNPVATASSDHLDFLGTGFNEINGAGPSEYSLETDFLIEGGGKRKKRIDVADKAKAVVESSFLDVVRTTSLDVQSAYVAALLARDALDVARQNLDAFNQIVEINTARVKAGDIAEVDLLRVRVAALQYANSVRRAELEVQTTSTRLKTLLGRGPGSPTPAVTGELRSGGTVPILTELRAIALQSRPDLRTFRLDAQRAAADLRLQMAQAKPDITLGAQYLRQQGVNGRGNMLGFVASVPLPVFNRNQGEVARASQEQKEIDLRIKAQELAIAEEVETAYNQYLAAHQMLDTIQGQMLTEARDVREITDFSYRRGEATLLEFLDAQRAFNETMQAYNEARAEYARSLYVLDAVCGKAVTQ